MYQRYRHTQVEDVWYQVGVKLLREYMLRKKLDSETTFQRFLQALSLSKDSQINLIQWRKVLTRENVSLSIP